MSKAYPLNIRIAGVFASSTFASIALSILLLFSKVLFVSIEFHYLPFGTDCVNCDITPTINVSRVILGLSFVFIIYGIVKVIKIYDSFGIRKELLVLGCSFLLFQGVVNGLAYILPHVEREGIFDFSLITVVYAVSVSVYIFPYQVWIAQKLSKVNIVHEEDEEMLRKVLSKSDGRQAFALYLACSLSLENLLFYDAASNWKKDYNSLEPNLQQSSADGLYEHFLSEEAFLSINVSYECKKKIRVHLTSDLRETVFDEAIGVVWDHMVSDIFPRFKKTEYFKASRNEIQKLIRSQENYIVDFL